MSSKRINFMPRPTRQPAILRSALVVLALLAGASLASVPTEVDPPKVSLVPPKVSPQTEVQPTLERVKTIPGVEAVRSNVLTGDLEVILNSDSLFQLGTATLVDRGTTALQAVSLLLKEALGLKELEIMGHTDDSPVVKQKNLYRSNWELSLARAASIVHVFEESGILRNKLKVAGYGDTRPRTSNLEHPEQNRRIVLRLRFSGSANVGEEVSP